MEYTNAIILIFTWISIIILVSIACRKLFPAQQELSRKIVHIGAGPIIPLAWALNVPKTIAIPVASFVTIGLLINHWLHLVPAIEGIDRRSYGTIAYGLSITYLLVFLWPDHADAVSAGVLVMAFGDGLAGLIGRQVKSQEWMVFGQRKSAAGTATMTCASLAIFLCIAHVSALSINPLLFFAIAILGTILEQVSPLGIDNLTVPIGVGYGWLFLIN